MPRRADRTCEGIQRSMSRLIEVELRVRDMDAALRFYRDAFSVPFGDLHVHERDDTPHSMLSGARGARAISCSSHCIQPGPGKRRDRVSASPCMGSTACTSVSRRRRPWSDARPRCRGAGARDTCGTHRFLKSPGCRNPSCQGSENQCPAGTFSVSCHGKQMPLTRHALQRV
jgi:hypothetical protein